MSELATSTVGGLAACALLLLGGWFLLFRRVRKELFLLVLLFCCDAATAIIFTVGSPSTLWWKPYLWGAALSVSLVLKLLLIVSLSQHSPLTKARSAIVLASTSLLVLAWLLPHKSQVLTHLLEVAGLVPLGLFLGGRYRLTAGTRSVEYQYVAAGFLLQWLVMGVTLIHVDPQQSSASFAVSAATGILFADALIAYGLGARRLRSFGSLVAEFFQQALVIVVLVAIYAATLNFVRIIFPYVSSRIDALAPLLAALLSCLALYPVRARIAQFMRWIFPLHTFLSEDVLLSRDKGFVQSATTVSQVAEEFSEMLKNFVGTKRVAIYLRRSSELQELTEASAGLNLGDGVLKVLQKAPGLLAVDDLGRVPLEDEEESALRQLEDAGFKLALYFHEGADHEGVVLLGAREGHDFYGEREIDVLLTMRETLSTAAQNAAYYSKVEDARVYNTMLLESLGSGVIAVDLAGRITLCNHEATRLLQLDRHHVVGAVLTSLPNTLSARVKQVLETGEGVRNQEERVLIPGRGWVVIGFSVAAFSDFGGAPLGVILVMSDRSQLRELQEQAHRADRRASLGTLAAGMAHEIKNPLVSVKTFTELLPLRYEDADYRQQFSTLVTKELERIEDIIHQLLDFAQPAQAQLKTMSVHQLVSDTLALVAPQCSKQQIVLEKQLEAASDIIQGDAKLLSQVLLNLLLNAIDAMESGGSLVVATANSGQTASSAPNGGTAVAGLRLLVRDTGRGISAENLGHIFDPFFTTKRTGTGLGLAISYGIVQEHGGVLDAESDGRTGTTFSLTLPLAASA